MRTLRRRILIVDDEANYRESVISLFDDADFEFIQAGSPEQALSILREDPDVQVVILDLQLGESKGTALLDAIRDQIENYRVIVLTAHEELLAAKEAAAYKVFSYVTKTQESFREALLFHINDAFTAIEKAWLGKKVDAHLEIERRVNLLGLSASQDADQELKEVLALICEHALDLLGAYTCHIRLVDPGRGDYVLWASKARIQNAGSIFAERVPLSKAYSGLAAETRRRITVANLQDQEEFKEMREEELRDDGLDPASREYLYTVRSACVDPISTGVFGNEIDSVFNINSDVEDFFSMPKKQGIVDDFVNQTALAITKYLLKKKRIDIHADYRNIGNMLWEISNVFIAGENDLDKIYSIVFERVSDGLRPEIISIFLLDEETKKLKNVAEYRADKSVGPLDEQYAPGVGIVGRVYSEGQTKVFVTNQDTLSRETESDSLLEGFSEENFSNIPSGRLRHYLGVPIKFGNDTIGVIRAINKRSEHYDSEEEKTNNNCLLKRGFSEDCQNELEITANHLAATIKNAELIGRLNKTVSELESLYAVGEMIDFGKDMDAAFDLIVKSAVEVMHAEICMLFKMNEKGDRIVLTQSAGMPKIEGAFYDLGEGKTGSVAQTGQIILEEKAKRHKGKYDDQIVTFLREQHGPESKGIESFMAVPIVVENRILGVIKVINKVEPPFQFAEKDVKLFQLFYSRVGLEKFLYTQRYLKNIVEDSPVPIIFLNKDGKVEIFNKACEQLWGYKSEDVIGKSVVDFYVSEQQARLIGKKLWESENYRIHNVEAEIRDSEGFPIPVLLSAAFLFDGENRIGSMGVFKDLREIRQYQDLMQRAEREADIGRLAFILSHNIKNDIAAGLHYIDGLKEDGTDAAILAQTLPQIEEALKAAVEKLNSLTRAAQPREPHREVVSVGQIFAGQIFGVMTREAHRKRVDFATNYEEIQHELVAVDIDQINEVLRNLFNNSLDAIDNRLKSGTSNTRGRIDVLTTVKDHRLELFWTDNGCGIAEEERLKIFDIFYTTGKPNGTGLGLTVVKKIIENHDGTISVESTEGEFAKFNVSLPVWKGEMLEL